MIPSTPKLRSYGINGQDEDTIKSLFFKVNKSCCLKNSTQISNQIKSSHFPQIETFLKKIKKWNETRILQDMHLHVHIFKQ